MEKSASEALSEVIAYMNGDEYALDEWPEPKREHGALIEYRQEAFHDVFVYEDGFEYRFYIGD